MFCFTSTWVLNMVSDVKNHWRKQLIRTSSSVVLIIIYFCLFSCVFGTATYDMTIIKKNRGDQQPNFRRRFGSVLQFTHPSHTSVSVSYGSPFFRTSVLLEPRCGHPSHRSKRKLTQSKWTAAGLSEACIRKANDHSLQLQNGQHLSYTLHTQAGLPFGMYSWQTTRVA